MSTVFGSFILAWTVFLVMLIGIGGYFMLRKFLKSMPKQDGRSELDWQDCYIQQTREMWTDESRLLLEELVTPIPELFRNAARRSIVAEIGRIALEDRTSEIDRNLVVKGYILATPARDHKWLVAHLKKKQIDYTPYIADLKIKT